MINNTKSSEPFQTRVLYTYNEATKIAHGKFYKLGRDDLGGYFEGFSYFLRGRNASIVTEQT